MEMLKNLVLMVSVSMLWGITNPFIKRGSKGITQIRSNSAITQFLLELKYLLTNIHYLVPMALNQLGSLLYFLALQHVDLSLAVPVTNSLTFVFTSLAGLYIGEKPIKLRCMYFVCATFYVAQLGKNSTCFGMLLVLLGTSICCFEKYTVLINTLQENTKKTLIR